jgi:hypothetical protein
VDFLDDSMRLGFCQRGRLQFLSYSFNKTRITGKVTRSTEQLIRELADRETIRDLPVRLLRLPGGRMIRKNAIDLAEANSLLSTCHGKSRSYGSAGLFSHDCR